MKDNSLPLPGAMSNVTSISPDTTPLTSALGKMNLKHRKPPKVKHNAFGPSAYGGNTAFARGGKAFNKPTK